MIAYSASYGIYFADAGNNNLIHHNDFFENSVSSQALDDGYNNQWYDDSTNEGNYWSDWICTGDYLIDGSAAFVDPYPLGGVVVPELNNPTIYTLVLMIGAMASGLIVRRRK